MSLSIEPLERYEDERGWVSEVYSGELGPELQNIHLGTMEPGVVRGNHAHLESREWIVFHQPLVHVRWREDDETIDAVTEEPSLVTLPENTPHAFKNESDDTVSFTAYRNTQYDEENPDSKEVELF
jgi:dTDP-4-dehydrorhamnose 3,5-epimerase-like enzyme